MATSLPHPPLDLKALKLADLKQVAKSVSVDAKGNKTDLILRLENCSADALHHAYSTLSSESYTPVNNGVPVLCPVCDKKFTNKNGEESIQCEGSCQAWYHRCCAGLTKSTFNELSQSSTSFCCLSCRVVRNEKEITLLKEQVSRLMTLMTSPSAEAPSPLVSVPHDSVPPTTPPVSRQPSRTVPRASHSDVLENRKFNLVLSGIPESPSGQSRSTRAIAVLEKVSQVFSEVLGDSSYPPVRVRDCRRLGKFRSSSRGSHSRPVLVTLDSTITVQSILSKVSSSNSGPVKIRRDLPYEDRIARSLLMKERWNLIQAGTERTDIKLNKRSLFVNGCVHGSVVSGSFVLATSRPEQDSSEQHDNSSSSVESIRPEQDSSEQHDNSSSSVESIPPPSLTPSTATS